MDEELNTTSETVETGSDDWDNIDLSDVLPEAGDDDEPGDTAEETPGKEPPAKADQPKAEEVKPEATTTPSPTPESVLEQKADDSLQPFTLKHMDDPPRIVSDRKEAAELMQKGLDRDRIQEKLDAANERLSYLDDLAKAQGMTVDDFIDNIRAAALAGKEKLDMSVAMGRVKNDRETKRLEAERKKLESSRTATTDEAAAKAKRDADIQAFVKEFPEAAKDVKSVPKEVWDAVHGGETLVNAYRAYETKRLRAEVERLKAEAAKREQKEKNKAAATGSMSTKGGDKPKDKWLDGWDD